LTLLRTSSPDNPLTNLPSHFPNYLYAHPPNPLPGPCPHLTPDPDSRDTEGVAGSRPPPLRLLPAIRYLLSLLRQHHLLLQPPARSLQRHEIDPAGKCALVVVSAGPGECVSSRLLELVKDPPRKGGG
jgi:hypothetical protein